jgi:nanoRNase/pAp phosphatase (c-di-AMP/oligoRNAs hydrolase)
MKDPRDLISYLENVGPVYLQTHDFPDHDSVAAAFGLQRLLAIFGIESRIVYEGDIQRESLLELIRRLSIDVREAGTYDMTEGDIIAIVDGCKGNKNVVDLIGREVAVIDHHETCSPEDVAFVDIRSNLGACSTIVYTYFRDLGVPVPGDVATALLTGIDADTSLMTRGVSQEDLEAYSSLYVLADVAFVNTNLRNSIQVKDLDFFKKALERVSINGSVLFCYFDDGCNQNLMGILGDFFLTLREIDFVVLCARNSGVINFSVRSERPEWNAGLIVRKLLSGIGFGGGHAEMAGGIIKNVSLFGEKEFMWKVHEQLGIAYRDPV